MSKGHGSSRRQAYGRRMKDLRTRRGRPAEVELEEPTGWRRGDTWETDKSIPRPAFQADDAARGARPH